ncbi:MAG: M48 family metallopeptidase [Cyclobacteriaceae bacterium]|nr:M48 family metallopeptidase [Cyclobacteriaceae bacterium]MCH8517172.1 M48 family metallopeptidase [Cyclobacteriaceae bacterium]
MAKYIGIQHQIRRNNTRSIITLIAFPLLIFVAIYAVIYLSLYDPQYTSIDEINSIFSSTLIPTAIIVGVWFAIAYFFHNKMINSATGSKPLERKENMRVYNLVENLCMQEGMKMPKVNVIESPALNAYASGLNENTYTVTLTRGIMDKLNDDELKGVIAHELMHIKNKDVRLLIVTIIFVGIFSFAVQILFRSILYGGASRRRNKDGNKLILVAMVVAAIAFLISLIFKFSLSRNREYMADSGAAEMTRDPRSLASALRKISGNDQVDGLRNEEVKEMFIENSKKEAGLMSKLGGLFDTHPPIEKRITYLEQF